MGNSYFASISSASLVLTVAGALACSSSSSSTPALSTSAAVTGPLDMHCKMNGTEIKKAIGICMADDGGKSSALSAADGEADAPATDGASEGGTDGGGVEAGGTDGAVTEGGTDGTSGTDDASADDGGAPTSDFGDTMYNSSGSDDDCKYDVNWTSTAVKENVGVTFHVNAIRRSDGKPATGADVQLEVFLNEHHPTPSNNIPNTESAGGNYQAGPVIFDAPGKWTVRFHFYEMCSDAPEDSPHGHAAFYVNVP